jgi:hypothetical protein
MIKNVVLKDADKRFISKYACWIDGCDENFFFKTTRDKLAARGGFEKTYQAVCLKCEKRTLMTQAQMNRWYKLFTNAKLEVGESKFDDFFKED